MRPNIEVMCTDKFQYATSATLALPYDHFLVSLLFLDVSITVIVPSGAIPTLNFIFECIRTHMRHHFIKDGDEYHYLSRQASGQGEGKSIFV